jgi:hypothetical protein
MTKPATLADMIAFRPLADLVPYANNSRTHSSEQLEEIKASIRAFGFTNSVLADTGGIVAGHGRVVAAIAMNQAGETLYMVPGQDDGGLEIPAGMLPVVDCSGWSEAKRRAYIIADNRLAENAGWNLDILSDELRALQASDFDLGLLGFTGDDLALLLADKTEGLTDPDAAPPAPVSPVTVLGDVWLLGRHRITCGDSTVVGDVDCALGGDKPHLMVTDPPYGVKYDPGWREKAGVGGTDTAKGTVLNDDQADWRDAWALFPGDVAYVWHGGLARGDVVAEA